ncbi:uncharacterized protein LOC120391802 isoform X2 [Mauremys reevesii]|uniref:uncharacterized protein LOC120391802 isoform X2 n=1 Tax=Mauremys reevesii TaxID=260615 RepID=UPI00193EEB5E|nr:uncharacterized protein LOC120391802 isoform X2 [Mauremys reevesii]
MAAEEPCASPTLAPEEPPASTTLATEEPPAITTLATEEPPASPEQELSECATNTSSSAYSCGASSSSVGSGSPVFEGSLFGDTPSAQVSWGEEEEEEEDLSPITVIEQHLQGRAELVADRAKQLRFLHTVPRLCFSAHKQGRDTLEPPVSSAPRGEHWGEWDPVLGPWGEGARHGRKR